MKNLAKFLFLLPLLLAACSGSSTPEAQPIIRLFYFGSEPVAEADKQNGGEEHSIYSATTSDGINFTEEVRGPDCEGDI
jgi:hypothetical protein